ncbi:MAG: FG-GAP-like repeat-containing protein [Brevirhabdus sp.]
MDGLVAPQRGKRLFFVLVLIGLISALFWTQSRYPALDEKATMSGAIQLEDPISFEAVFPVTPDMPMWQRVGFSTLNWIDTNKKGMTFGILFGAALLTLFGYLQRKSVRGGFSNSFLGMFIGAPLGVCVNCAAPIARGLYAGGARAETTLSAMVASPTLNIVVLTMLFSLLPLYMAVTKIALSLLVILVAVPLICRLLPQEQLQSPNVPAPEGWAVAASGETVLRAGLMTMADFGRNLWFIIRTTVPLMLLAGFLGALVATLLPGELLLGLGFSLGLVVLVAVIGTFLPVPIAFDVVVAGALLGAGLSAGYIGTLVFTLGTFSIYSFFIVATSISKRAAWMMAGTVALFGVIGGVGIQVWHDWQTRKALEMLTTQAPASLIGAAHAQTATSGVTLTRTPLASRRAGDAPFTRLEAWEIGVDKPIEFSFRDMWPPFWEGRSLASGDIDRDGDADLVIASTRRGLYVYSNDGAGQFTPLEGLPEAVRDLEVFNAVLVDLDNDGWRDLFLTTYRTGMFVLKNVGGRFDAVPPKPVANREGAMLVLALSFGDVDQDGDLDAALGNWTAGWYRRVPGEESRNRLIFNEAGQLDGSRYADLPGMPGETLSILFSDINIDGKTDLLVGNDFEIPDAFYLGDGSGGLSMITRANGLIEKSTTTTMAIKTADLANDGTPEIYEAQIAGRSSGVSATLKMQPLERYCDTIKRDEDRAVCLRNMQIKTWYKSGNNFDPTYAGKCQTLKEPDKSECKAMLVKDLAIQNRDGSICNLIPKSQPQARAFCMVHFLPPGQPTQAQVDALPPQVLRSNVLLVPGDDGHFRDEAESWNLHVGGWSWDTKIADFDNDGDQDIYIVNGTWVPNEVSPSNLYFRNNGDRTFSETSGPMGLEDYLMTAAATVFDLEGDGDLDVITQPVNGPVAVFRNDSTAGNAMVITLEDHLGNRDGVGARVALTRPDGVTMTRELQLGGGFMSFDDPVAHFGLGAFGQATHIDVHWADGSSSSLEGPFEANARLHIRRQ